MDDRFLDKSSELRNEYLLKTEHYFIAHRHEIATSLSAHMQSMCNEIKKLQQASKLSTIAQIDYTMSYMDFLERRYIATVWVYGRELYNDIDQLLIGEFDISPLFVCFDELWDKLLAQRKRYVGAVRAMEVKELIGQALPDFYSYLASAARSAVANCIDNNTFDGIVKDEVFRVFIGEYMNLEKTECVYVERKNKNAEQLVATFAKQPQDAYIYEDYANLDFSQNDLSQMNFSYSSFRESCLTNVSLKNALLAGTVFAGATMMGSNLNFCTLLEADFSHANLQNASFVNVYGRSGLTTSDMWQHVGFQPVSFRYADLTNADFTNADLVGADFTGAILTNADFTDAMLDNAIFNNCVGRKG